jgi:hypothetical protein
MSRTLLKWVVVATCIPLFIGGAILVVVEGKRASQEDENRRLQYQQQVMDDQLADLKNGKTDLVYFPYTKNTDDLLSQFRGMPEVQKAHFELTDLSQDGMITVSEFPNLRELTLYGGRPSTNDNGLQHLSGHRNLEALKLINTDVTNDGLKVLHNLPKLRSLTLFWEENRGVRFNDKALETLRELKNLEEINVSGGWASKRAVQQLKADMPDCKITTNDPT